MAQMQTTLTLRPRTSGRFASLMELYERNYMLMRLLAPRLREMGEGEHVSRAPKAMPLVLSRIVHDRYTTTFNLTYRFSSRQRHAREPDLAIRLYHDARTCEVMSGLLPEFRDGPRRTRDLDDGWRLNRFLHRWLGYCLRQGHVIGAAAEPRPDVAEPGTVDPAPIGPKPLEPGSPEGGSAESGSGARERASVTARRRSSAVRAADASAQRQ